MQKIVLANALASFVKDYDPSYPNSPSQRLRRIYGDTLLSLRSAMVDQDQMLSDETLGSVLMLDNFDVSASFQ